MQNNNETDEMIIGRIHKGDDLALEFLINKYKSIVKKKARTYFLIGADNDDIIQEGMIGLYKAIRDYKDDRQTSFKSFAELCITRQIISAVKASTRQKHVPLNSYISLDKPVFENEDKEYLMERVSSNNSINPEDLLIDKENVMRIEYELDKRLSDLEKEVLALYLDGYSYVRISEKLDKTVKSIDNTIQRIKKKLEQLLKEINE